MPRGYQIELFERACQENIIAYLETGSGKTLVSALLIKKTLDDLESSASATLDSSESSLPSHDHGENAPSETPLSPPQLASDPVHPPSSPAEDVHRLSLPPSVKPLEDSVFVFNKDAKSALQTNKAVVFLVHRVPLVLQQAQFISSIMKPHIDVGAYYGERGVDDWSSSKWARSLRTKKVLVMTAQIFLNLLRHGLLDIRNVALLVMDEVHHATKNHPYRRLLVEFYHTLAQDEPHPRIFGMTASPVKAKAASQSSQFCIDAILALEATLDATVVTVSNEARAEVELMVPKPVEFVVTYRGSDSVQAELGDGEDLMELETTSLVQLMELVAENGEQEHVSAALADTCKEGDLELSEIKMLELLCVKLGYRPAAYFAREFCALRNVSSDEHIESLLRQSAMEDIELGGITNRVYLLLDVLFSEFMRARHGRKRKEEGGASTTDLFRCIVFVRERITAVALSWLLNAAFKNLQLPELTSRSAVGVQNSDSRVRMSHAKLIETLEDFRKGSYGILVATNVVEEGLDVPACRLVVAFDKVISPAAYVQARGRARKHDARYIAFLQHGSVKAYNEMYTAREGAKIMKEVIRSGINADEERKRHRQMITLEAASNESRIYSRTTRAQVTATEAVNLLHRYTLMKATVLKDEEIMRPQYETIELSSGGFTCHVTLHAKIPIDGGFCKESQPTEALAKRLAALDAYSKLYQVGEVDDFLFPKRPVCSKQIIKVVATSNDCATSRGSSRRRKRSQRDTQPKEVRKDMRLRQCNIAHPAALRSSAAVFPSSSSTTSTLKEPESLFLEVGRFSPTSDSMVELETDQASFSSTQKTIIKSWRFLYSIQDDQSTEHLGFHSSCQDLKFGLILENEIPAEDLKSIRCPDGENLISLTFEQKVPWSELLQTAACKYVRSIQLCLGGRCPGSPRALEIEERDFKKNAAVGFLLVPLRDNVDGSGLVIDWLSIEKLLCFGWRCGPLEEGQGRRAGDMQNILVCSYHDNLDRVYLSGSLNEQFRASSHPKGMLNPLYKSFADYFGRRHETILQDSEQIMMEGFCLLDKLTRVATTTFMLPPETCRVIPLSPMMCYIASLLPRWQTFLALRSCWRRNRILPSGFLDFARALQPNVNNVAKHCADFSYERLEFLGDAVLKVIYSMAAFVMNPNDSEGILSDERDVEVSNQRLADLALEMQIHNCLAFSGVSQKAKAWPWFWGAHQNKSIDISEKVLADCVESLIGVQYLQGGIELATIFMDRHKLFPKACEVLGIASSGDDVAGVLVPVPDLGPSDDRRYSNFIREVEEIIGYTFLDKGHLVVALTHGSFRNGNCPSYQRYEYLGDAIIGFLLLSYFFHKYPEMSPGDLTGLRGPALSNHLFARVIVSLGIHHKFWFDCQPLELEINKFANLIANEDDDEDVCKSMTVPKVLGDLLESIIGAIVVDKGMKLDGVQEIALRLMDAELDRFANPEKFKRSPISELVHFVQRVFNMLPEYKYLDDAQDTPKNCIICVNGREISCGIGPTRRIAKHRAAVEGLRKLMEESDQILEENE